MSSKDSHPPEDAAEPAPSAHAQAHAHAHHLKYGAGIRTEGFAPAVAPDSPAGDAPSPHDGDRPADSPNRHEVAQELVDSELRRIHGQRRYLIRRPRALQYFRGPTLVRSADERTSGRIELFFDLTMVGIIAVLAKEAVAEPTGASLARFIITYLGAFMIWSSVREFFNVYYCDDMYQRFLVMFVMACLIVYGNNAPTAEKPLDESPARAGAIGAYLLAQFAIRATDVAYSFHVKAFRWQLRAHALIWVLSVGLWIGAIFAELRTCIALAVLALALEWGAWTVCYSPAFRRCFGLYYSSASGIDHEIERFNDFVTLVLGEFLFSVFENSPAGAGMHNKAGRAIMAVVIAMCFQLLYMLGASSKAIVHPIRHSMTSALLWFNIHLPIVCALTLCGDVMAEMIAESEVERPLAWLVCESYAVAMVGLWALAMIECDLDKPGDLWIPKVPRLLPRLLAGVVAVFLPLAHHTIRHVSEGETGAGAELAEIEEESVGLPSTKLLGILTALSSVVVLFEQVAALDGPGAPSEQACAAALSQAEQHNLANAVYLTTPPWSGVPTLVEPGILSTSTGNQRLHPHAGRACSSDA